jgi:hypothetical protein
MLLNASPSSRPFLRAQSNNRDLAQNGDGATRPIHELTSDCTVDCDNRETDAWTNFRYDSVLQKAGFSGDR